MSKANSKNNSGIILIAIIGAASTICAASIGALTTYNVEKMRQESELTRIALVSVVTQGGETQISMANTISAPTDTPYPTQTMQPTFTPYPTYTQAPIPTIPPTQSVIFPFTDTFDTQLNPAWKVVNGTPLIMNGALRSTNGNLTLELPGNFPPNYVISFDFNGKDYYIWGDNLQNTVEIIFSSRVSVRFDLNGAYWRAFNGSNWNTVSDIGASRQITTNKSGDTTYKFVVRDNYYQFYWNNSLFSEIRYGEPLPPGPIGIYVGEFMQIDNFTITLP